MADIKSIGGNPIVLGMDGLTEDVQAAIAYGGVATPVTDGIPDTAQWATRTTAGGLSVGGRATIKAIKGHTEVVDGALLSANPTGVESVGFNQIDLKSPYGTGSYNKDPGYQVVAGTPSAVVSGENPCTVTSDNGSTYKAATFVSERLIAGSAYKFKASVDGTMARVSLYTLDAGHEVVRRIINYSGSSAIDKSFTPTSQEFYFAFYVGANAVGTVTVTNAMLFLTGSGYQDGEYEPYWHQTLSIPASTYFPSGLRSAGSGASEVCDELRADAAVTRVGVATIDPSASGVTVEINSTPNSAGLYSHALTYTNAAWALTGLASAKLNVNAYVVGVESPLGTSNVSNFSSSTEQGIAILNNGNNHKLYLRWPSLLTEQQFKDLLTTGGNSTLFYALATPTSVTIDPPLKMTYRVETGGTETMTHTAASSALTWDVEYAIDAAKLAASVAPAEGRVASTNYASGSLIMLGSTLVKATTTIVTGEEIIIGTNCSTTTVAAELAALA